ncbi:accessory Sec system protein translocase subunit SecY2 [Streptococcus henryi]
MMKKSKRCRQNMFFAKKLGMTVFVIFLLLLGQHITLPFVKSSDYFSTSQRLFSLTSSLTGGNLTKVSLFSIGLSPYMTAVLVWRLTHVNSSDDKSSIHLTERRIKLLALAMAAWQSFAVAINLDFTVKFSQPILQVLFVLLPVCLILVTGSFVTLWIGNLNTKYGIGGITLIILLNMVHQLINQFTSFLEKYHFQYFVALLLLSGLIVALATLSEKAEYRIGINHPSIYSSVADESYLPIKVNPAGGLPIMYAMTLLMLPQYIILGLNFFTKSDLTRSKWLIHFTTTRLSGISIYLTLVFLLAIIFSIFNIDPRRLAEQMRKENDYIEHVNPGKPTQIYIRKLATFFGVFSGIFMVLIVGTPLIIAYHSPEYQTYAVLPGLFVMLTSITLNIIEEIRGIRISRNYKSIFASTQKE